MKKYLAFAIVVSSLVACSTFLSDPEQKQNFVEALVEAGFTPAQIETIINTIRGNLPSNEWWQEALWTLGGIVASLFGVRLWRGGITTRKGEAPIND